MCARDGDVKTDASPSHEDAECITKVTHDSVKVREVLEHVAGKHRAARAAFQRNRGRVDLHEENTGSPCPDELLRELDLVLGDIQSDDTGERLSQLCRHPARSATDLYASPAFEPVVLPVMQHIAEVCGTH